MNVVYQCREKASSADIDHVLHSIRLSFAFKVKEAVLAESDGDVENDRFGNPKRAFSFFPSFTHTTKKVADGDKNFFS